jgi:transposase
VLVVEQWVELRRPHFSENVGVRELARRFRIHRKTVRPALQRAEPTKYSRPQAPSKLDPFKPESPSPARRQSAPAGGAHPRAPAATWLFRRRDATAPACDHYKRRERLY